MYDRVLILCDSWPAREFCKLDHPLDKAIGLLKDGFESNSQFWILTGQTMAQARQNLLPLFRSLSQVSGIVPCTSYKRPCRAAPRLEEWDGVIEISGQLRQLKEAFAGAHLIYISALTSMANPAIELIPLVRKLQTECAVDLNRRLYKTKASEIYTIPTANKLFRIPNEIGGPCLPGLGLDRSHYFQILNRRMHELVLTQKTEREQRLRWQQ